MNFKELLAEAIKVSDKEMKELESMGFNFSDEWSGNCADVYINNTGEIKVIIEKCKSKFPVYIEVDSYNKLYKSISDKDKNEYEAKVGFKSVTDAIKFVK